MTTGKKKHTLTQRKKTDRAKVHVWTQPTNDIVNESFVLCTAAST